MQRLFTIFALFACINLSAQVTQEIFESFKLQERRDVTYYIPEDYDVEKKYPVVIVLDGEYLFDQVVANSKVYSRFHGMPQMIVVGINQSKNSIRLDDCAWSEEDGLPSEKGKKFFEFLGMELIPYVDLNYSTAPFKMIVGYDITANFQNYWLFKENSLFNAYVVLVAFMYSPCTVSSTNSPKKGAVKEEENIERNAIMNTFYEMEMPEIEDSDSEVQEQLPEELIRKRNETAGRRDIKQDPKDKAKEKLWESIVNQADDSDDDSSGSDGKI